MNAPFYSWAGYTGGLTPSHGEAFINGRDVQTELGQVRSITGICSQDNLLYEELSGLEHLEMYGRFRGVLLLLPSFLLSMPSSCCRCDQAEC